MLKSAVRPLLSGKVEDWHSEYAYTLGLQAFIYGFPYIYYAQLRDKWVTEPSNPAFVPYAAVNEFWHASRLIDASYRDGGCPSNDTLYSIERSTTWVFHTGQPVHELIAPDGSVYAMQSASLIKTRTWPSSCRTLASGCRCRTAGPTGSARRSRTWWSKPATEWLMLSWTSSRTTTSGRTKNSRG
jgi:hypothetical protein